MACASFGAVVGHVVELLVAQSALEADRVQAHRLDVLHVGEVRLRIPALEHVPDVAAAAKEDVLPVDLVAREGGTVDHRAIVRHLADPEVDGPGVGDGSAALGRDAELVEVRVAELVRPPERRAGQVQLWIGGRAEADLPPLVRVQGDVLAEGDRGVARLADGAAHGSADRRAGAVEGVDVYDQVGGVRGRKREHRLDVGIAQGDRPGGLQQRLAPDAGVHVGRGRVPVHRAEGEVVAAGRRRGDEHGQSVGRAGLDNAGHVVLVDHHGAHGVGIELSAVEPDLGPVTDPLEAQPVELSRVRGRRRELSAKPPVLGGQIGDRLQVEAEVDVLVDVVGHQPREHGRGQRDWVPAGGRVADLGDGRGRVGDVAGRAQAPAGREFGGAHRRSRRMAFDRRGLEQGGRGDGQSRGQRQS